MLPLIKRLVEITLLRKGPEDIPRSRMLLLMAVSLWVLSVLTRIVLLDRGDEESIAYDVFSALVAVTGYAAILAGFGKSERLVQTLTATLGCSALLSAVLTFAILVADLIGSATLAALFVWIYLPWAIAVRGHIIASAINRHWYLGLVFAVLIFVLQYGALIFLKAT